MLSLKIREREKEDVLTRLNRRDGEISRRTIIKAAAMTEQMMRDDKERGAKGAANVSGDCGDVRD